jgi:hypothetical protein
MTKRLYNIEVLLQYWNVKAGVPQNYPMTRVPPQQQKRHDSEAQRSPNERRTRKLFTVVTTQTLPFPVEIVEQEYTRKESSFAYLEAPVVNATELSSQSPKPEGSYVECFRFSDVNGKPKNVQPTSLVSASKSELQERAPLHAAKLPYSGEQKLEEDTKFAPE